MKNENYLLRLYKDDDYEVLSDSLISKKYLHKYLNKGLLLSVLSFCGLYKSTLYLLECNYCIVASGVIRQKFDFAKLKPQYWLYGIEVVEQQRGKGIGSFLMEKLLENLKNNHIEQVFLKVAKDNTVALNLYGKCGFIKYKTQENDYILILKYNG